MRTLCLCFTFYIATLSAIEEDPFAPQTFVGTIKKCRFLNQSEYSLFSSWVSPIDSSSVIFYRIYDGSTVIGEVAGNLPLVFNTCLTSKSQGKRLELAAVFDNFAESAHVPIEIIE